MICRYCSAEFVPAKSWQQYCSEACRYRQKLKDDRDEHSAKRKEVKEIACPAEGCAKPFLPKNPQQRFCSDRCRNRAYRAKLAKTVAAEPLRRTRLRCTICGGRHFHGACRGRRPSIKLYGTMGPNREYVPPAGVAVRYVQIPYNLDGERLTTILRELDGGRR